MKRLHSKTGLPLWGGLALVLPFISLAHGAPLPKEGIPDLYARKKLIAVGWDSPNAESFVKNLREMEQTPFDGVRILLDVTDEQGRKVDLQAAFRNERWKREWFADAIAKLKAVRSEKLTDNFLSVGPGSKVDWFDDAAWEQVVDHLRIAAWVAKEGGLKGILFDPEKGTSQPAFSYNRQPNRERYSFAEYAAKVRQRGREAMEAMAEEYPDMVIFTLFLNGGQGYSPFFRKGHHGGRTAHFYLDGKDLKPAGPRGPLSVQEDQAPLDKIEGGSYHLIPAFVNGWLDAIPPTMVIVDGLEQTYTATDEATFHRWAHSVYSASLPLVAPENRAKYRAQVRVGFGIYLDAYVNPSSSKHYVGPTGGGTEKGDSPRVQRLGESVQHAVAISDEYVWLWGEKYRWWPTDRKRVKAETWDEVAPGISDAIRYALDPTPQFEQTLREAAAQFEKAQGGGRNLVLNGNFANPPAGEWAARAEGNSVGGFGHDAAAGYASQGSLRFFGPGREVLYQEVDLREGKAKKGIYGVRAWVRQEGKASAQVRIRWKRSNGELLLSQSDRIFLSPDASLQEAGGWVPVSGIVVAPPGVKTMVVELIANGGPKGEQLWFDAVEVSPVY